MNLAYFRIRRRRFRFSLGTLFLLFTLIACGLGYEAHWIRARHRLLAELPRDSVTWGDAGSLGANRRKTQVPFPLGLFGERPVAVITLDEDADSQVAEQAERLFPEAKVWIAFGGPGSIAPFSITISCTVTDIFGPDPLDEQECPTYENDYAASR